MLMINFAIYTLFPHAGTLTCCKPQHAVSICNFSGLQSVAFKGVFHGVEDLRMLAQITSRRCRCDGGIKEGEKSDLYAVPSYSHRSRDISKIMSVYIKLFACYCIHHLHVPGSVYVQHARTESDMFSACERLRSRVDIFSCVCLRARARVSVCMHICVCMCVFYVCMYV